VLSDRATRYRFGLFEFDAGTLELYKNGRPVRIRPQSLKLLKLLLARPGELVSRGAIRQAVWGADTFVDFEQGVNHCIKELRTALGDTAESPRYIQTLPRRGYRFITPVETLDAIGPSATAPPQQAGAAVTAPVGAPIPTTATASEATARHFVRSVLTRRGTVRIALTALAIVLVGALIASFSMRFRNVPRTTPARLAVLPFSTAQGDPALGIGLAAAIASRLAGQQAVAVQSVAPPNGAAARLSQSEDAARSSGATLVIDGEITATPANVTVRTQLKDIVTGATVWSERFSEHPDELFNVEDVIAERVASALSLRLAAAEQDRLRRRYTSNTEAYRDYLHGRAAMVRYTPDGTREAIQAFERALERDRNYALARAGLALACADMYLRFAPAAEVESWGNRTELEARAAIDLDPDLAEAHLARAAVARKREFDWSATIAASRRALVLNPNLDQAHFFMAAAYYHLGYMEEAIIEMQKGRALHGADRVEPLRIEALVGLFSGNFVPARVHLEEVSRTSSQAIGDTYLALAYYYSGNGDRALAMLRSLESQASASVATRSAAARAGVVAARGEHDAARMQIERVLARAYRDHHVSYSLGAAYAQLGDIGNAVRWLRTAADTGFPCLTWFERDPLLEPLRRRPEFTELLAYVRSRRDSSLTRTN
jgi:DNA-binding winged helix-turn-helix (wHTH) protein/TolB-like protein